MLQSQIKKILIGTSGLLLLALGGVIVYNVFFLSNNDSQAQTPHTIKFYERDTGNVVQINGDGSGRKVLDDVTMQNLQTVRWAPTSSFVATQNNGKYSTYNHKTDAGHTFSSKVSNLHFTGNKVAYTYNTETGVDLSIADPSGGNFQTLVELTSNEISLSSIPTTYKISYTLKPSAYRASSLTVVSSSTQNSETLISDQYGLQVSWSPQGKKALLASASQRGGSEMTFTIIDSSGTVNQTFGTGTVLEKTVWKDPQTIYFTKPNLSKEVVMPDDYLNGNLGEFRESLYKLDLSSGQVTKLIPDIGAVNSRNLFLNEAGTKLFFINQRDGRLYRISLPS